MNTDEKIRAAIRRARYKYQNESRSDEAKEANRENIRRWKKNHPEKQREYEARFYLKKAIEYGLLTADDAETFNDEIRNKAAYEYQKRNRA